MGIINSKYFFRQHGAGTVTWPTTDKWSGGNKTLTATVNAIDLITKYFDGTNYFGGTYLFRRITNDDKYPISLRRK